MKPIFRAAVFLAVTAGATGRGQVNPYKDPTPGIAGFRAEVMAEVRIQEDKFLRLADAVPAEKYTWRPAEGVRSVAEVFLHVSVSNYYISKMIGAPIPEGLDAKNMEKSTTEKAAVIDALRKSFAHQREAILKMSDADLEKPLDWFGDKNTERGILLFMVRHTAEHLGQSIAYARSVGVVPPWTADQQRQGSSREKK